jgi:hypothetical protein
MIDLDAMSAALDPTRKGLEAAGFSLALAEQAGDLKLTVAVAQESACEDCLVPKSLFKRMAVDEIEAAGHTPPNLVIAYPADVRRQQS